VALDPLAIVPSEQVKLGVPTQVPCDVVTVPRVKPAGNVSASETACASDWSAGFVTVIVYVWVTPSPATTLVTPSDFVTERFADVVTVFESVAVLLLVFPSSVVVVTDAEFT
jgi:hypothetical protein